MLPGRTIIMLCVHCREKFMQPTLMSGNTLGARFWTDGWREAPMLPDQPWLVKCPGCAGLLWLDEAEVAACIDPLEDEGCEHDDTPLYGLPTEEDYLRLLSTCELEPEKEREARIRAWWEANHAHRGDDGSACDAGFSDRQLDNLAKLSGLLNESASEERLMMAEIARERGDFEEAMRLLNKRFPADVAPVADAIRSLSQQNVALVAEVPQEGNSIVINV